MLASPAREATMTFHRRSASSPLCRCFTADLFYAKLMIL